MPYEITTPPIGDPEPVNENKGLNIWHTVNAVAIVGIGFLVFTAALKPRRLSGATRSARLEWELRQFDMQKSTAALNAIHDNPEVQSPANIVYRSEPK